MPRFGGVAGQGLLTGDGDEFRALGARVDDALHVLEPCEVGTADPDAIDGRMGDHFLDRSEGNGLAHVKGAGQSGGLFRVAGIRAIDPADVSVANRLPCPNVKLGDKAAADETDA